MEGLFKKLGIIWDESQEKIFTDAFTHRSAVHDGSDYDVHNERLEFLGDAVLELITTEFLFEKYPKKTEGDLTSLRAALVKGDHLAEVAKRLKFGDYLILSEGEKKSGGAQKDYLLANMVEAFIGALYRVHGKKIPEKFIHNYILCDLESIISTGSHIDAKSKFQEIAQKDSIKITPRYEVLSSEGLDHEKVFTVAAYLGDTQVGTGKGTSKKLAQTEAAKDALSRQHTWDIQK